MVSVDIALKRGGSATIEDLRTVKVLCRDGVETYDSDKINEVPVFETAPYVFVGAKDTLSISGSEILYIAFRKG